MKTVVSLTLAVAALSSAVPAVAGSAADTRSTTVGYLDLNLATAAGKEMLADRVRHAAGQVCGQPQPALSEIRRAQLCRVAAFETARPQMDLAVERARRGTVDVAANAAQGISVAAGL